MFKELKRRETFWDDHEDELAELGRLRKKIAAGQATNTDKERARDLEDLMGLPDDTQALDRLAKVDDKIEDLLEKLQEKLTRPFD